jgi:hypothetical protein
VPNRLAHGGYLFITLLIAVIVLFACFAIYFFFRNRKLQARLSEEVREIGSAGGNAKMSYRRVKDEVI